jgi:hypothetical protein
LDNEAHNPANGDALQHTAGGLLVWRKSDNFTAFTDGFRTWINGPHGLAKRPNGARYSWEANPEGRPLADPPSGPVTAGQLLAEIAAYDSSHPPSPPASPSVASCPPGIQIRPTIPGLIIDRDILAEKGLLPRPDLYSPSFPWGVHAPTSGSAATATTGRREDDTMSSDGKSVIVVADTDPSKRDLSIQTRVVLSPTVAHAFSILVPGHINADRMAQTVTAFETNDPCTAKAAIDYVSRPGDAVDFLLNRGGSFALDLGTTITIPGLWPY